jgi:hypothetical protein
VLAVRYQEFLDNIEPGERVYHLGDPAAAIREALACARAQGETWQARAQERAEKRKVSRSTR